MDSSFKEGFPSKIYASSGELAVYEVKLVDSSTLFACIGTAYKYRSEGLLWYNAYTGREVSMSVLGWRKIEVPTVIEGAFFRAEKVEGQWEIKAVKFEQDKRIHYPKDYNFALKWLRALDEHEHYSIKREVEFRLGRRLTLDELVKNHGFNPKFDENRHYYPLVED